MVTDPQALPKLHTWKNDQVRKGPEGDPRTFVTLEDRRSLTVASIVTSLDLTSTSPHACSLKDPALQTIGRGVVCDQACVFNSYQ